MKASLDDLVSRIILSPESLYLNLFLNPGLFFEKLITFSFGIRFVMIRDCSATFDNFFEKEKSTEASFNDTILSISLVCSIEAKASLARFRISPSNPIYFSIVSISNTYIVFSNLKRFMSPFKRIISSVSIFLNRSSYLPIKNVPLFMTEIG